MFLAAIIQKVPGSTRNLIKNADSAACSAFLTQEVQKWTSEFSFSWELWPQSWRSQKTWLLQCVIRCATDTNEGPGESWYWLSETHSLWDGSFGSGTHSHSTGSSSSKCSHHTSQLPLSYRMHSLWSLLFSTPVFLGLSLVWSGLFFFFYSAL